MQNKKKNRLTLIALEPRLVFDGAGAATETLIDPTSSEASTADVPTERSVDTSVDTPRVPTVELPAVLAQPNSSRHEVVVVDGALDNLQNLLQDIAAADPNRLIVVLDPAQDEVSQLITFLQQHTGEFDAVHVLSHGGQGWISLGDQTIVLAEAQNQAALWAAIQNTLTADGDLLLYGCEIAADAASQTAVTQLAKMTGADIAASSNITGVDGDWTLEYRSGSVEAVDIAAPNWEGNLWLTEALQASWWTDDAGNRNLVTTAVPSSLTFSNMASAPGVALGFYQFGSATTFKISNVDSTSYAGSVAANEYIKTTFTIKPGLTNGYAVSKIKFRAYSSPASAYMSVALYDTTTGTMTTLSPWDLSLSSNNNGSIIYSVGLNRVPVLAGRTYELRMYVWGGGSYKTVYIDQPQVYAAENQFPVATADTFTATAGTTLAGNLVSTNNGAGVDSDPEVQTLSVSKINGAAYTVGSNIALAKGTLSITNANGAFTFTPAAGASGSQTFTYTIIDGVGGSATATATINITVPVNDPPLSVNHVAVNEGSPFVVSEVTGAAGQMVKLQMGHTGTGLGYAVIGTDTQNANGSFQMQYFNGTAWTDYTANSFVAIPNNTNNKLLVRTRLVNDGVYEGYFSGMERYLLTATSQVSASNSSTAGVYIYDDGTGQYFPDNTTGTTDPTAVLDDDRPSFSVNDVSVNESAGTMTFTVTKTGTTALSSTVNYVINDVTTAGAADYSAGTSALNGTLTFAAGVATQTVTINIVNDALHEPTDTLNIVLSGAAGATIADATGVGTIVDNDARVPVPVSVSSITVNEASSYAVFTVSAEPGSVLDLATSPGTATAGSMMSVGDYANSIQFWNGSAWITTTVFNAAPTADANGTLKVRVGITDDSTSDNGETFTLQATYRNNATNTTLGVAIGSSATGTGTIVDDGSGSYWNSNVDPLAPATDPVVGPTIDPLHPLADDDRAVTIDDQTVNEASPYAVQTITGNAGQYVRLVLDVTGTGTGHALAGSDYTNALEYWNGIAWTAYTAGTYVKMPAATMQVRVAILNDSFADNNETYKITAYNTGGAVDVGTVTIADDGSGKKWSFSGPNDPGSAPAVGPGPGFDDERALTITGFTVNEKSPYGVFTVAGVAGQYVTLTLADGVASGGVSVGAPTDGSVDYSASLQYFDGSTWQNYTAGSYVLIQSDGVLRVRTAIVDDAVYEMSEGLTLTAANTSGMAVTATGTIVDDGQGDYFGPNDPTPNPNPPTPLDDDRPRNPAFVDDLIVNEGSPFVVFTVTGVPTAGVTLSLSDGTALAGVDYTNSLQYWSGSAWTAYDSSTPPVLDNIGKLLVRAPVLQDNSNEPDESLQLSVQYTGTRNSGVTSLVPDTSNSFTGTAWIVDDGNGNFFPEATPNNNTLPPVSPYNPASDPVVGPTLDPTRPLPDDDRAVTVNDITVNEASPYAVLTVNGFEGQYVKLVLGTGTATAGTDYTAALEYWNGTAWTSYTAGSYVKVPADADSTAGEAANLLVRVAITDDNTPDNGETFTLTATNTAGTSDQGTCTIADDGSGKFFPNQNPVTPSNPGSPLSPQEFTPVSDPVVGPTIDPTRPLPDDDRAVTVNDITVNEASPYAVFTVNGFEGQYVKLVLGTGTATAGTDYTAALEYWNGTAWTSYTAGSYVKVPADADSTAGEAANLLVRVAITDDSTPDNGETFTLTAYNTGGGSDVSTCTIADDGSGKFFPNLNPVTPSNPGSPLTPQELTPASDPVVGPTIDPTRPLPDDERTVTVNDITVNEASPYAVFTVNGFEGQYVKLVLGTGTATAGSDYTAALEYWNGSAWTSYTAGSYVKVPADADATAGEAANLLVRVAIANDNTPDNGETFTLTAYNTAGVSDLGTCTIADDGSGKYFPNLDPATPSNPGSPTTPQEYAPASDPVVGPTIDPTRPLADDERTLQVTGFMVNEASPFGIFTVTGAANQYVRLSLTDGTAKLDTNGTPMTDGSEDYGPQLQFYDPTSSSWVNYAPGSYVKIPASGTTLLVRTAIVNDVFYEISESFMLTATSTGGSSASDVGVIRDDGQGDYFGSSNSSGTPDTPPGSLDDDRPKNPAFVSDVLISEGSPYAVFHVSGAPTAQMTLTLAGDTAEMGTDFNNALQVFVNSAWVAYNGTNAVLNNRGDLMVRTTLNNQQAYEGIEYFKLNAAYTGTWDSTAFPNLNPDTTRVFSGRAGIVDDGTGVIFRADDPATVGNESAPTVIADDVSTAGLDEYAMFMDTVTPTFANVVDPATSSDPLADDDRTVTVNDITVNEASPYAVFTVNGFEGQYVKLVLGTGTATAGTDYTAALEYWDGSDWSSYTPGSYVKVPDDTDGTSGEAANLLVRVAITNDNTPDNGETFTLTAYNTGGANDQSTCTIADDSSGKFFPNVHPVTPSNPGSPTTPEELTPATDPVVGPTLDPNRPLPDDDRAVTIDDITVNEASPYAIFTVEGREGQYIQLDLAQGTATAGVDYAQAIEYWNGNTWVRYTPGSYIQLPTDGDNVKAENASLKVRVTITNDTFVDNGETFSLVATNTGGTSVHGLATLFEDDTGNISSANANANSNLTPHTAKDDDPRNVGTAPAAPILATAQGFSPWATEPLAAPPAQVHVQTAVQQTRLVTMDLPVADALIDKFDRQTDPHLYVLPAVWSSRVRMQESVMATQALHSGWLNQIDALTNPSGLFMLQALAQDPAVPTLADQTLAQMREEAQGLPPALESPHTPQVAAEEAPPTPKPLQRGALSFSQQLQQTATQRRASASV